MTGNYWICLRWKLLARQGDVTSRAVTQCKQAAERLPGHRGEHEACGWYTVNTTEQVARRV